jgi:hypothetical protein
MALSSSDGTLLAKYFKLDPDIDTNPEPRLRLWISYSAAKSGLLFHTFIYPLYLVAGSPQDFNPNGPLSLSL